VTGQYSWSWKRTFQHGAFGKIVGENSSVRYYRNLCGVMYS
jgi:hypothetical protein